MGELGKYWWRVTGPMDCIARPLRWPLCYGRLRSVQVQAMLLPTTGSACEMQLPILCACMLHLVRYKGVVVGVRVALYDELLYDIDYEDGESEAGLPERFVRICKPANKRLKATRTSVPCVHCCCLCSICVELLPSCSCTLSLPLHIRDL